MTEGDWNLVVKMIESRLEREGASRCEGRGAEAVVGARWLASLLANNERLRQQVTEVQARNTALEARARAAEADAASMRDVVRCNGAEELERVRKELSQAYSQCDLALTQRDDARDERDVAKNELAEAVHERMCARRDMDAANAVMNCAPFDSTEKAARRIVKERDAARNERDEARAALASVTASRDALADACAVPPELARLFRAAQGALKKYGVNAQRWKASEECGEFVAVWSKEPLRTVEADIKHELHDVLTVALSLCEPDLMAKAAERLEGRLG